MNLKKYLETDVIDFELHKGVIKKHKKLFNKNKGLRSYITPYASYIINYRDKTIIMTSVFEEILHEIKAFKIISEHYGFKFGVSLLEFVNLPKRDNIIQTIKWHVVTEKIMKTTRDPQDYNNLINSDEVIQEAERRFDKFLTLKEYSNFSISKV